MARRSRLPVVVLGVAAALASGGARGAGAQTLALALFERYLEPLRLQAGIPGLSAAIVLDGQVVWELGLGMRDLEGMHAARPDTPYPIGDLTQTVTSALLFKCAELTGLSLDEPLGRWVPESEWAGATLRQVVSHAALDTLRGFRYQPLRFALLARPIEECGTGPLHRLVAQYVLEPLAMIDAVPGYTIAAAVREGDEAWMPAAMRERYEASLARMARPYKVARRGRVSPGVLPPAGMDGAGGLVASVRDLAKFDAALDAHVLLRPETLEQLWTPPMRNGTPAPFAMGWFVQGYQGETLVWHFGHVPDAYSSLLLKIPDRRLTLILLANSDGLSAPFALHEGDVTSSLFARTFLRLFL